MRHFTGVLGGIMSVNEGSLDRAVRMTVGIQMMALGLSGVVAGTAGITLIGIGGWLLATGTVGRCPIYKWFGWTTVPREGAENRAAAP
jgi:hypothetical protein